MRRMETRSIFSRRGAEAQRRKKKFFSAPLRLCGRSKNSCRVDALSLNPQEYFLRGVHPYGKERVRKELVFGGFQIPNDLDCGIEFAQSNEELF